MGISFHFGFLLFVFFLSLHLECWGLVLWIDKNDLMNIFSCLFFVVLDGFVFSFTFFYLFIYKFKN